MNEELNNNEFYSVYRKFIASFEEFNKLDSTEKTFTIDKMIEIENKTIFSKQYLIN